jgi:hypothetical protein
MASKGKKSKSKQENSKDAAPANKTVNLQVVITAIVTMVVAYLGYRQVVEVPKLSLEATQTAQVQSMAWTQTALALLPPPSSTSTATPAYTSTPTPTMTFTLTPSVTPSKTFTPSPTATSTPQPLTANCIDSKNWTPDSTDLATLAGISASPEGCYSLAALGIFTDAEGMLYLNYGDKKEPVASGIYTPIEDDSVIEFKVHVNSMFIVYPANPVYVSFAVAPEDNPMTARTTARFKLQVEDPGDLPIVHFVLAHVNESNGAQVGTQHYEYGRTYRIRLELVGNIMKVYINDLKMDKTPFIPTGPKVFYIGYNIPIIGGVDVNVSDVTVDGEPR